MPRPSDVEGDGQHEGGRRWFRKLLSVPGIVVTAALTAAAGWGATQFLSDWRSGIEARDPLAISVEENPARIGGFSDLPILGLIPGEVQTTGSPGPGCDGFRAWVESNSGVDAQSTKLQIVVQGKVPEPVLLSSMRVKVLEHSRPITGIPVECPPAAQVEYRAIAIDLDAVPPRVTYQSGKEDFGFTVAEGETEAFTVIATTTKGYYEWLIELDVVVEGDERTLEIGAPDNPFKTTAAPTNKWWSWDYERAWHTRPREGIPGTVPAGMPLPPLT
jgi:hypothetical protein